MDTNIIFIIQYHLIQGGTEWPSGLRRWLESQLWAVGTSLWEGNCLERETAIPNRAWQKPKGV